MYKGVSQLSDKTQEKTQLSRNATISTISPEIFAYFHVATALLGLFQFVYNTTRVSWVSNFGDRRPRRGLRHSTRDRDGDPDTDTYAVTNSILKMYLCVYLCVYICIIHVIIAREAVPVSQTKQIQSRQLKSLWVCWLFSQLGNK